jgi:hypothetical protein
VEICKDTDGKITHGVVTLRGKRVKTGKGTKNLYGRTTFINKEAAELLEQWLPKRRAYIKYIIGRSRGRFRVKTAEDDRRVFPFGKNDMGNIFRTALKKAELFRQDEDTGIATVHPHMLRKYFITQMTYGGVPDKYVQYFAGHIGKLDRAYNKPTTEALLEMYMRGEPHLRIFDESAREVARTREEMRETKDRVRDIQIENLMMRSKLTDTERAREYQAAQISNLKNELALVKEIMGVKK